jgi:hypothetical protein
MAVTIDGTTGITAPAIDVATPLAVADIPSLPASQITSGTVATARLGSGTADSTTFLRGDQTWATVSTASTDLGGVGSYAVLMMAANTNLATGSTIAGSSLRYDYSPSSGVSGNTTPFVQNRQRNTTNLYDGGGTALSGTWRKVSTGSTYIAGGCSTYVWYLALYVRIS